MSLDLRGHYTLTISPTVIPTLEHNNIDHFDRSAQLGKKTWVALRGGSTVTLIADDDDQMMMMDGEDEEEDVVTPTMAQGVIRRSYMRWSDRRPA